jgi:hypothetical protein
MIKYIITVITSILLLYACKEESKSDLKNQTEIKYNVIEPANGIYIIKEKDLPHSKVRGKNHEVVHYDNGKIFKVERYDQDGKLTDDFSVAAVTSFEYDDNNRVKYLRYFDKDGNNWEDNTFGYWSIEYIYDESNKVRMEIYRDADSKFLSVPRDNMGNIAKVNFISPVLTYEYLEEGIRIKALDQNFNLLKEIVGDKPCIPFIDCGDN